MEPEKQKNENYIRTASSHHTSPPTAALPPPPPPPQSPAPGQASSPPWRSRRTTPGKSAPGLGRQPAKQLPASDCMNAVYGIVRSCKGKDDFETKVEVKHENVQSRTSLVEARWSKLSRKNDIKPKYKQAGAELSETLNQDQVMGGGPSASTNFSTTTTIKKMTPQSTTTTTVGADVSRKTTTTTIKQQIEKYNQLSKTSTTAETETTHVKTRSSNLGATTITTGRKKQQTQQQRSKKKQETYKQQQNQLSVRKMFEKLVEDGKQQQKTTATRSEDGKQQ